jgi:hypothetical protein
MNHHISAALARARTDDSARESARRAQAALRPTVVTRHDTQRARVIASLLRADRRNRERPA